MNQKVLILAPHPDDELLIAGALIYTLRKKKYDITVAYYTNGDSVAVQGFVRMQEALESLKVLGVSEDHAIFLGYGNNWKGGMHVYNMPDETEAMSYADRKETYCIDGHQEYCMNKFGKHHRYTRQNIKKDIKSMILDIHADIIICVDFDSHADHRALSLFFEEAMGEILKSDERYTPIVLKKFAYTGVSSAKWDYYSLPMLETKPGYINEFLDERYELDNPIYLWNDRIQLKIDRKTRTRHICRNVLYKAACKHKSQKFDKRVGAFANADIVYWQRRTDSISYLATVSATSGRPEYVNDFKMIDCSDILSGKRGVEILQNCVWIPDADDNEKRLFLDFAAPVRISKIYLYENFLQGENIVKAQLSFDTGKVITVENFDHKGRKTEVIFDTQHNVKHLEFQILKGSGTSYGLTELEIYEDDNEQDIPLERYQKSEKQSRSIENDIDILFERKFHNIIVDHSKESIYYDMYQTLMGWDTVGNAGVVNWLKKKNYTNIAIYGMGDFGRKLEKDLEKTDIRIRYVMDQYAGGMTASVPIVRSDLFMEMPEVDVIVVTVTRSYKAVKKDLMEKGCNENKIVSLQQIILEAKYLFRR